MPVAPPPDFSQAAKDGATNYGFSNPGRPPCGVSPGSDSLLRPDTEAQFADQFNRTWQRALAGGGNAGIGDADWKSVVLGVLLLGYPATDCVANVEAWRTYYYQELKRYKVY
jgi:hypothetical protein